MNADQIAATCLAGTVVYGIGMAAFGFCFSEDHKAATNVQKATAAILWPVLLIYTAASAANAFIMERIES